MASNVVVRSVSREHFAQVIETGKHRLYADEQESVGGSDRGPGPYECLLAAPGTWTSMTLRMYAERKNFALTNVEVQLSHIRIHAKDCEDCETKKEMLDEIRSEIHLEGDLDKDQRKRLSEIATRCPVHRTLHRKSRFGPSRSNLIHIYFHIR